MKTLRSFRMKVYKTITQFRLVFFLLLTQLVFSREAHAHTVSDTSVSYIFNMIFPFRSRCDLI